MIVRGDKDAMQNVDEVSSTRHSTSTVYFQVDDVTVSSTDSGDPYYSTRFCAFQLEKVEKVL
jgi:hypothetical protein